MQEVSFNYHFSVIRPSEKRSKCNVLLNTGIVYIKFITNDPCMYKFYFSENWNIDIIRHTAVQ